MVLTEAAGDAVSDRESLNSPTKEAEPRQPSLKVFTVSQEKNCYLLYAAAEQVDHRCCQTNLNTRKRHLKSIIMRHRN
jgi:hypothetical protein